MSLYQRFYFGWSFPMGNEILNAHVFGLRAERDLVLAQQKPDEFLVSGTVAGECETCGELLTPAGSRLGPGCRDCR